MGLFDSLHIFLLLLGVAVGSFLNVVGLRYSGGGRLFNFKKNTPPYAQSSSGRRSHCPHCGKILSWYELIPLISYFIQMRRCRGCHRQLSLQYPLIELLTGFAFLLPVYFYQFYAGGLIFTLAALAMILIIIIDWRLQIIPDQLNLFIAGLGLLLSVIFIINGQLLTQTSFLGNYTAVLFPLENIIYNRLFAAGIALLFFGVIIIASLGRAMGIGDLKLAVAMGLMIGWPDIAFTIGLAFIIGSLWGLYLLLTKRKKLKQTVPFGPFLVIGFWLTVFFGHDLLKWYFSLI